MGTDEATLRAADAEPDCVYVCVCVCVKVSYMGRGFLCCVCVCSQKGTTNSTTRTAPPDNMTIAEQHNPYTQRVGAREDITRDEHAVRPFSGGKLREF